LYTWPSAPAAMWTAQSMTKNGTAGHEASRASSQPTGLGTTRHDLAWSARLARPSTV
jgi:hypothetical protein